MPRKRIPDRLRRQSINPGDRFGRLVVLRQSPPSNRGKRRWVCLCDCGKEKDVGQDELRSGDTRSCGCLHAESMRVIAKRHGLSGHPLYHTWCAMMSRCHHHSNDRYQYYGGRGIKVCERWRDSPEAFLEDMGPKPSPDLTLDRRDNEAHYSCGKCPECLENGWDANCHWATRHDQDRNKRSNVFVEFNGERLTLADWAIRTGIDYRTLTARFRRGWRTEDALTAPAGTLLHNRSTAESPIALRPVDLSDEMVREMRTSYADGIENMPMIAARLSISLSYVSGIIRGNYRASAGGPITPGDKRRASKIPVSDK